jgi:hypothetical protein
MTTHTTRASWLAQASQDTRFKKKYRKIPDGPKDSAAYPA